MINVIEYVLRFGVGEVRYVEGFCAKDEWVGVE
jgi:hypothetical protein